MGREKKGTGTTYKREVLKKAREKKQTKIKQESLF
jgi:hypothetical protein